MSTQDNNAKVQPCPCGSWEEHEVAGEDMYTPNRTVKTQQALISEDGTLCCLECGAAIKVETNQVFTETIILDYPDWFGDDDVKELDSIIRRHISPKDCFNVSRRQPEPDLLTITLTLHKTDREAGFTLATICESLDEYGFTGDCSFDGR